MRGTVMQEIWNRMQFWEFYFVRVTALRPKLGSVEHDTVPLSSAFPPPTSSTIEDARSHEDVVFQVV